MPVIQPDGAITRPFSGNSVADVKFAPDGSMWVANGATLQRIDVVTGQVLEQFTLSNNIQTFDISADGRYVAGTAKQDPSNTVKLFYIDTLTDTVSQHSIAVMPIQTMTTIGDVVFLNDGTLLLARTDSNVGLLRYYPQFGNFLIGVGGKTLTNPTLISSADNDTVFVIDGGVTNASYVFSSTSGFISTDIGVPDPYAGASLVPPLAPVGAISNDETRFAYGTALEIANAQLQTTTLLSTRYPYLGAQGMVFSPAGDRLYIAVGRPNDPGGAVIAFDTTSWDAIAVYPIKLINGSLAGTSDPFSGITNGDILQISDNGRYLSMITSAGVQVIDLTLALPIADGGNNTIDEGSLQFGLGGNDTLGAPGNQSEFLYGGEGDDTYLITGNGQEFTYEYANQGTDQILTSYGYAALPEHTENLAFIGTGSATLLGNSLGNTITGGASGDSIGGAGGTDTLIGGDGDDTLATMYAPSGFISQGWDTELDHDILVGGNGDDTLWIGPGDNADGGPGTDTLNLSFSGLAAGVTFDTAAVLLAQPYVLSGGTIQNIERFGYLQGTGLADTLNIATQATVVTVDGDDGNDTITANGSALLARGGNGDDSFFSGSAADTFDGGNGFDTVLYTNAVAGISLTASSGGTWTGAGGDQLTSVEKIVGSGFADTLTSGGGTVALWGGGGNDTLTGGSGTDQLVGQGGDDTIQIANSVLSGELFDGGADFDTLDIGSRSAQFYTSTVAGVEQVSFGLTSGPMGAGFYASQIASSGITRIMGSEAFITFTIRTDTNSGTFTMPNFTLVNWVSPTNPLTEQGDVLSLSAVAGTGDYVLNAREGLASVQVLSGGSGNDTLNGSSGADILAGNGGINTLNGNGGNDILRIVNAGFPGVVDFGLGSVFNGGDGWDALHLGGKINLQGTLSGIEQVHLEPVYGTDIGLGPVAQVTISAQTMAQLPANLQLSGTGTIKVVLAPGEAFDASGYVHAPGSSVSLLVDASSAGGSGNNELRGSAGNDVISGGAGNDVISGGLGNDTLTGGTGDDLFRDTAAGLNGDTIADLSVGDRIQLTDATFASFAFSLSGSTLTFTGGSLALPNLPAGYRLSAAAAASGGVELTLVSELARDDFNGDGRGDILWRHDSGVVTDWLGQANGGFVEANVFSSVSNTWRVAGTGDFNGDGRGDILWRHDSGVVTDWLGQASGGFVEANVFSSVSNTWHVAGTGDFNGDGRSDILWRHDSGVVTDWLGQANGGFVEANVFFDVSNTWHVAGTGDFNGDGRGDILWRHDSGVVTDWLGQANGGFVEANVFFDVSNTWRVADTGDFNGDGRGDILWRHDSGVVTDWLGQASGGFVEANVFFDVSNTWHVADTGDFNGDGRGDILWRHDSGVVTDWLGQASGGFVEANVFFNVSNDWHILTQ